MKAELPGSMLVIGLCHSVPFNIVAKCNWVLLFRENTRSCIPILCVRVDVGSCCKIYYYVSSPLWNCTSEFILLVLLVRASCSFDTTLVLLQNTEKYIEIYFSLLLAEIPYRKFMFFYALRNELHRLGKTLHPTF